MSRHVGLSVGALVCALTLVATIVPGVSAASVGVDGNPPRSAAELQAVAAKDTIARQEELHPGSVAHAKSLAVSPMSCVEVVTGAVSPATICPGTGGVVVTYPRHQDKWYYCGVATAQDISNYWWNMGSTTNKYTQQVISDNWTKTDAALQTTASAEQTGLQGATKGSPRWTAGFTYYYKKATSGSQWHSYIRVDVSTWNVPLATSVAPRDPGFAYYLSTWVNQPQAVAGHWITLSGWSGVWDGTESPQVTYDDSYIGSNGTKASMSAYDMWQIVNRQNASHAPGYIVQ